MKSSARVGYLNTILAQGGGNLNNSIFKNSNARGLPGGGMLMFRIDRRIKLCSTRSVREREENILHRKLQRLNSKAFRQSKLERNKNLS